MPGEHGEHQAEPVAVDPGGDPPRWDDLGRRDQRLDLDQQRARPLHRAQHAGARHRRRLTDEPRRGIRHLGEPAGAHLEHRYLARRSEPVLERAQRPVAALALPLEHQNAIDEVLERSRPRERALLGHVPDHDHRDVEPLRDLHQLPRCLAHLRYRARCARRTPPRAASEPSRRCTPVAARPRSWRRPRRALSRRAPAPRARAPPAAPPAAAPARPIPRPTRTASVYPHSRGCQAPSRRRCSCRSPASPRGGRASPARPRPRARDRAPRSLSGAARRSRRRPRSAGRAAPRSRASARRGGRRRRVHAPGAPPRRACSTPRIPDTVRSTRGPRVRTRGRRGVIPTLASDD